MKKQSLLLLAGGLLAFASCNNEASTDGGMSQAQVDSAVNARLDEMRAELTAQNDSLINALAQWKADSMIAAMKGTTPPPARPSTKVAARPKPAQPGGSTTTAPDEPKPNTPTGKNSDAQKTGQPTGKNSDAQQQGQPTGKRSQQTN